MMKFKKMKVLALFVAVAMMTACGNSAETSTPKADQKTEEEQKSEDTKTTDDTKTSETKKTDENADEGSEDKKDETDPAKDDEGKLGKDLIDQRNCADLGDKEAFVFLGKGKDGRGTAIELPEEGVQEAKDLVEDAAEEIPTKENIPVSLPDRLTTGSGCLLFDRKAVQKGDDSLVFCVKDGEEYRDGEFRMGDKLYDEFMAFYKEYIEAKIPANAE